MNRIEEKFLNATRDILEKNLQINELEYKDKQIILVYDFDSILSTEISN
ncbi:hypothetical protein HOF65_02445 [bacterium]|jgi:uncharacterized Fe-S cluster-containing protein|nr:hypothetical protein [bacterium]MBT3852860.1 hypothetical protein [bacterium]MBT4632458.1 hypothetical protein [bacterium]MBT5491114.1 hypothetical protein [bacterium]MBT6779562.1 hypothetical protein [bacterium]